MIRGDKMLYSIIVWYYIMLQTILFCVACPRSQPVLHHQHKRGRLQPRDQAAHRTPLLAGPLPALSCRADGCDGGHCWGWGLPDSPSQQLDGRRTAGPGPGGATAAEPRGRAANRAPPPASGRDAAT